MSGRRGGWRVLGLLVLSYAVLVGAVVAVGWLVSHHPPAVDDDLARWLAARRTPLLSHLAQVGRVIGLTPVGEAVLGVVGVVTSVLVRDWRPLAFVVVAYAGIGGAYYAGTHLDPRPRPPVRILDSGLVPDHSFPSGHVGTATAIALCTALLVRAYARRSGWTWVLALVPAVTLASRLYQGAHHLTDVLTALVTAVVWCLVCARLLLPRPAGRGRARRT